ncbi:histidine kinase dimerization/phospho-acceptor domain-containing protein [Microbacteriaceae bacterium 4G12]
MKKSISLLKKYVFIIFVAIILFPVSIPLVSIVFYYYVAPKDGAIVYYRTDQIEKDWHEKARTLQEDNPKQIEAAFYSMKKEYPQATMFWVDRSGKTQLQLPQQNSLPQQWSASNSIDFMKKSIGGDPYTVVAYMGENTKEAFMVFQISRKYLEPPLAQIQEKYNYVFGIVILLVFAAFIFVSWLFFRDIRKRLIRLQGAMVLSPDRPVPKAIAISKMDEIGLLEQSFNHMVNALEESHIKEREEEQFRRKLIADLSHDLRTPLTALRAQIYSLKEEVHSTSGIQTIELADGKIQYLAELIENLLSYSLLTSKKYPYHPEETDMIRMMRTIIATWYNTLEERGFEVDVQVSRESFVWSIDVNWFQRMIDNVIQNVIRHAESGKFIGFYISHENDRDVISIVDHGPGFEHAKSSHKGAGIGLSIIAVMAKEMEVEWEINSSEKGTIFSFIKRKS